MQEMDDCNTQTALLLLNNTCFAIDNVLSHLLPSCLCYIYGAM